MRSNSSSLGESMTWRGYFPLPSRTWTTIRWLSISVTFLLHFRATQVGGVHGGQQGAMLQVHSGIEQSPHLLSTQDGGELAPLLGLGYFLVEPGLFEDAGVEKLEGGEAKAGGGPGQLALIDQIQLVLTDVFRTQLDW